MELVARNFPSAYHETLWKLRVCGAIESSRNGPVVTLQEPFVLTITNPRERVVSCPVRNANPFFHVMETIWMFAGQRNIGWLKQFNGNIEQYANNGVIHGAYGHRWLIKWGDQINTVINQLRKDPTTRQAVLTMWDPVEDPLEHWKDRPCNTHIYFRVVDGNLDMTICNRSNDLVWGMFGANCVHMSYLQELVAYASGHPIGKYRVMTNNLHFYPTVYPNAEAIWKNLVEHSIYGGGLQHFPILSLGSNYDKFRHDCMNFVCGWHDKLTQPWFTKVAKPMHDSYLASSPGARVAHASLIEDPAWNLAALLWLERRYESGGVG